jgi:hypothetical protein
MSVKGAFSGENAPALLAECGVPEGNVVCCAVIAGYQDGEAFASASRKVRTVNYVK